MRLSTIVLIGVAVCVAWLAFAFHVPLIRLFGQDWSAEVIGQWGDTFGALNTLFSALAFLMVLITIKMQGDDIKVQQRQLDESRDEQLQLHFESTFYRMLSLLRELKAGVLFEYSPEFLKHHSEATTLVQKGDDALSAMAVELEWWVDLDSATLVEDLTAAYEEHVFVYAENGLGPYFRVLHTMLRTIDDADYLKPSDKIEYGNLLRSQLTSNELLLAGINGMVPASRRFQAFLTHYRMLKYLRPTPLRAVLQSSYPPEAFLGRDHAGRDLVARRKNVEPPAPSSSP